MSKLRSDRTYICNKEDVELRKLKPLKEIDPNCGYRESEIAKDLNLRGGNWFINRAMVEKFGSGKSYEFKTHVIDSGKYTHMGDDGYWYHKSWFEREDMFNEEDFLL
jgi:hypothetical protein